MFRYIENANHDEVVEHAPIEEVIAPATPEPAPIIVSVQESEQEPVVTEESQAEKIVHVDNGEVVNIEEEIPVPEVVDAVPDSSQPAVESKDKIEELPKKSYASIVIAMKQNGVPFSSPAPAQRKPQIRKQEQHVNKAQTTIVAAEPVASRMDAIENGIHVEGVSLGHSVYIKGLPMSATSAVVEEEFKKFGTIKPNGIQVRSNRGFCFGFVEFEAPDAVQKAIEASPILISEKNIVVEEKRSSISRGGNRGRFIGERGPGFSRNDSMRDSGNFGSDGGIRGTRGNYSGGRGYNRGGNRNDYGFRSGGRGGGPPSNHGSDGYQRRYNSGDRVNPGVDVNETARNTA